MLLSFMARFPVQRRGRLLSKEKSQTIFKKLNRHGIKLFTLGLTPCSPLGLLVCQFLSCFLSHSVCSCASKFLPNLWLDLPVSVLLKLLYSLGFLIQVAGGVLFPTVFGSKKYLCIRTGSPLWMSLVCQTEAERYWLKEVQIVAACSQKQGAYVGESGRGKSQVGDEVA